VRRFRFRLESVLRHRLQIEEKKERAFVEAQQRRRAAQRVLRQLEAEVMRVRQVDPGLDLRWLEWREQYVVRLRDRMAAQEQVISLLAQEEEQRRQEWLEARRDRQVLDKLKEKAKARHRAEELWEEQRDLDEWAVLRSGVMQGAR
jgi:flagellar FliJ protein